MPKAFRMPYNSGKRDRDEDGSDSDSDSDQEQKRSKWQRFATDAGTWEYRCDICGKGLGNKTSAKFSHQKRCIRKLNDFLTFSIVKVCFTSGIVDV